MDVWTLKTISAFVVVLFIGLQGTLADFIQAAEKQPIECPDDWVALHRGCYKFIYARNKYLSWQNAVTECKNIGGELIVIQSQNEREDIKKHLADKHESKKWWVNLSKTGTEWKWGDLSLLDQKLLSWKVASMKNKKGRPCALIGLNKNKLSLSNDRCNKRKGYICEYHKINPRASTLSALGEKSSSTSPNVPSTRSSSTVHASEKDFAFTVATSASSTVKSNTTPITLPPKNVDASSKTISTESANIQKSAATQIVDQTSRFQPGIGTTENAQHSVSPFSFLSVSKSVSRVTRSSTTGVSFPPLSASTSDDLATDNEMETDSVTESQREQSDRINVKKSTPIRDLLKGPTTRLTSTLIVSSTMTTTDVHDDEDDDDEMTLEEIIQGTDNDGTDLEEPSDTKGGLRSTSPLPKIFRQTTAGRRPSHQRSFVYWLQAMKEYEGCYIPGMRGTVRQMVKTARNLYQDGAGYCPQVTASRLTFPRTRAGETAVVDCRKGTGLATLHCGDDTVCWEDQPDLSGCASPRLKALLEKIKEEQIEKMVSPSPEEETAVMEQSFNMTAELVSMTEDDDLSMEDILVTSEVLTAFTHSTEDRTVKVKGRMAVKKIVGNVVKAGSNLLSRKKKKLWKKMRRGDKIRSASSLMIAMEATTLSMADNIDKPTVIKQIEENIEVEIQVVDVEKLKENDEDEVVYDSDQSENTFSIPLENLKSTSDGELDKLVFITHYSMAEFMGSVDDEEDGEEEEEDGGDGGDVDNTKSVDGAVKENKTNVDEKDVRTDEDTLPDQKEGEEEPTPQIASYILSASIGGAEGHKVKLQKPVTFTMKHTLVVQKEDIRLCSFWDVSQGGSQGFWSQEGCRMKKSNSSHTTCQCDHMTSFAILIDVHGYDTPDVHKAALRLITIIGCVISCLCLIVSWLTFQFCTALQGERNSIHKNLTACLFVSELLFVAGVTHTEPKINCSVVAIFLHFFFLCAFTWMFLEGLHIIFMLVQVFDATKSRLPYYYAVGYGLPAVVVAISCIAYFPGYGTEEFCWLSTDRQFIWAFAGPVALILMVNAIFLTYAMTTVCRHSDYVFNAKDRSAGSSISSWVRGALALEVLLGLTWTLGYFLLNDNTLTLAYAFTILNSLQGVFIFIFHCVLNKKAQKEYFRILRVPLGISSIFASTQSTTGKRTNGSTKCNEMTHSSSNSRKTSLHYKPSNASQHNNYFDDKYHHQNGTPDIKEDVDGLCNNNGTIQTDKDAVDADNVIISFDSTSQKV